MPPHITTMTCQTTTIIKEINERVKERKNKENEERMKEQKNEGIKNEGYDRNKRKNEGMKEWKGYLGQTLNSSHK